MSQIKLPHNTQIIDFRKPMKARAEETVQESGLTADATPAYRRGLRWHLDPESHKRIMDMMACWQCITTFPARPIASNVGIWDTSGFNHVRPRAVANRLIRAGCCPVCAAEISPEMLGIHDEGENPLNDRDD